MSGLRFRKPRASHVKIAKDRFTSSFLGVYRVPSGWAAVIGGDEIGIFHSEEAAAQAYDVQAKKVGRPTNF